MLLVSVWDRGMAGAVEKAIRRAQSRPRPIGEGATLRVPIPGLNAERLELVKG